MYWKAGKLTGERRRKNFVGFLLGHGPASWTAAPERHRTHSSPGSRHISPTACHTTDRESERSISMLE